VSRPCKCRWIGVRPSVTAFRPCGAGRRELEAVELGLDELEAIRLADYEGLYQDAAAERMGISRATFGRLIERARHKVASALINARTLVFRGGTVMEVNVRTFECADCGARFQAAYGAARPAECPSCHGRNFHRAAEERGGRFGPRPGGGPGRGCCRRRGWRNVAAGAAAPESRQEAS